MLSTDDDRVQIMNHWTMSPKLISNRRKMIRPHLSKSVLHTALPRKSLKNWTKISIAYLIRRKSNKLLCKLYLTLVAHMLILKWLILKNYIRKSMKMRMEQYAMMKQYAFLSNLWRGRLKSMCMIMEHMDIENKIKNKLYQR